MRLALQGGTIVNSEEKTRITVDIYGTQYKLMGNSSVGYMKMVAAHVNEHMSKIAKGHPRLDTPRIAVLAAVNMADEWFKQKEVWEQAQNNSEHNKMMDNYQKLKAEHQKLEAAHKTSLQQMEEQRQKELNLTENYRVLQDEMNSLTIQHDAVLKQMDEEKRKDQGIHEEYEKLREEYTKLQNEYNEWIQLAEQDHPGRK